MSFVGVIGQLLPLIVAVAISSVPLAVVISLLLATDSARAAVAFTVGLLVGTFVVTGLFAIGLQLAPSRGNWIPRSTVGWAEIVIGLVLVAYGVVMIVRRRRVRIRDEEAGAAEPLVDPQLPKWLHAVGKIRAFPALGLGLLMAVRPKALLLSTAAGLIIGAGRLDFTETMVALLLFSVLGISTLAVPVIITLADPRRMRPWLERAQNWLARNSGTVTVIVAILIGTVILGDGLTRL